jgi:iron complex transport system substrate-binding protein
MYPQRIICLTEEPTEVLYALEQDERIVGISGFTVRPSRARHEKPRVSAFTSARIERILELKPDLVIGFSDIQADIAAELIRRGVEVWISNHRTVPGILSYIRRLGALVGVASAADRYANQLQAELAQLSDRSSMWTKRPRVYFEEWDEPMISGISWVSELIGIAGGVDIFSDLAQHSLAKGRIIADGGEVIRRGPDIIIGSWCGKRFRASVVGSRPGWDSIPAVRDGELHEIKSSLILQPGPAALTAGVQAMHRLFLSWSERQEKVAVRTGPRVGKQT